MISIRKVFSFCEMGLRNTQEDAIWPPLNGRINSNNLFAVCDGLGGQAAGDIASNLAVRAISAAAGNTDIYSEAALEMIVSSAIEKLAAYALEHPLTANMATTIAVAGINKDHVALAWCGDSRIIHIRNGAVMYQTEDHSLVHDMVIHGELTEYEAHKSSQKNVLNRSLSPSGNRSLPSMHSLTDIRENDWLVICSDGFLELLSPENIAAILVNKPDIEQLAIYLYNIGLGHTRDNCSGHIIQLGC